MRKENPAGDIGQSARTVEKDKTDLYPAFGVGFIPLETLIINHSYQNVRSGQLQILHCFNDHRPIHSDNFTAEHKVIQQKISIRVREQEERNIHSLPVQKAVIYGPEEVCDIAMSEKGNKQGQNHLQDHNVNFGNAVIDHTDFVI